MSTETEITAQLSDYFGWVERQLADTGLTGAAGHGSHQRLHRRLALAAAAVLLVGGVATLLLRREPTQQVRPVAVSTTVTQSEAAGWQRSSGPPITERFQHVSIATADGWFVWGGYSALSADPPGVALHDGAYYTSATGEWAVLPDAPFTSDNPYVGRGVWTGGEVVITQGGESPLVAAFDPAAFTWRTIPIPDEIMAVWQHDENGYSTGWQSMIGNTLAVLFGRGSGSILSASMLLVDVESGAWAATEPPPTLDPHMIASSATQLFVIESGAIDSIGGCLGSSRLHTYDASSGAWSVSEVPNGNWMPASVAWVDETLVLAGGIDCVTNDPVRTAAGFDPVTGEWSALASLPIDHLGFGSRTSVTDGTMLTITAEGRALAYDSALDAWWFGPSLRPAGSMWIDDRMQIVVIDGRLAVWSPGWGPSPSSSMCCDSTGEVFSLAMPDATAFGVASLPFTTTTSPVRSFPTGTCARVIEAGDSIASIADRFGITIDELVAANPGELTMVPGDVLVIPISPCPPSLTTANSAGV